MDFSKPGSWPDNVKPLPNATLAAHRQQQKAFDELAASIHDARGRELRENFPAPPSSDDLVCKLMMMPAANSDQLSLKLRFFALELSKEADFGQNPDLRLIPMFASIQRDCVLLLKTQLPEGEEVGL